MFKIFERKRTELEKMAGVEEHQPSLPVVSSYAPMPAVKKPKQPVSKEVTACPKCGTFDCISLEEYQRRIKISSTGVLSVDTNDILQCCSARQQLNRVKEINITKSSGPR